MILRVLAVLALTLLPTTSLSTDRGLTVVVTFSNLVPDVKQLICAADKVESLVPPGVDPHDYELRPEDLTKLSEADIIISTAHAPFEKIIGEKVREGELKAKLVEIPNIEGIVIKVNPATGQPNYHMPIYDPYNYLTFMRYLKSLLVELNPPCTNEYERNFAEIKEKIEDIIARAPQLKIDVVATSPQAQYAVEWMGMKVRYLIMKERGVPATSKDLLDIRKGTMKGELKLMVIVGRGGTQINNKALELANENGLPYIVISSPLEVRSIPDKLEDICREISSVNIAAKKSWQENELPLYLSLVGIALALGVVLYLTIKKE